MTETPAPKERPVSLHTWHIPLVGGGTLAVEATPANVTVIVGANGSGKSALGLWLGTTGAGAPLRRLAAHRRLWFEESGPNITFSQRESISNNIRNWDVQPNARWVDHGNAQRPGVALFDLLSQDAYRNKKVADLVDGGQDADVIRASIAPSPVTVVNEILRGAGLLVQIELTERSSFDAINEQAGARYPISEMSDGEKSALLLAAEVLTVDPNSILIIDEPERHMHRSISAGLIEAVARKRPDCHFVVLTHDLDLASGLASGSTTTVVVTDCGWADKNVTGWSAHVVGSDDQLPEGVRSAVLGGRKRVLFVEGAESSLDLKLFRVLYPEWAPVAAGGYDQVIRAVKGLTASTEFHWVVGRGIVDGDRRPVEESDALRAVGVFVLGVHEVESLYYMEPVVRAVAQAQASNLGTDGDSLLKRAVEDGLRAIADGETPGRLAATVAESELRRAALGALPNRESIGESQEIVLTLNSTFSAEFERLHGLAESGDLESIVCAYPVRDTALRAKVSAALRFRNVADYEAAALTQIRNNPDLAEKVRARVGNLSS